MDAATKLYIGIENDFVKLWPWNHVTKKVNRLDILVEGEVIKKMLRTASTLWTLLSVRTTLMSVDERWFQTYLANALGSMDNCYVDQIIVHGHIWLLVGKTEKNGVYEKVK